MKPVVTESPSPPDKLIAIALNGGFVPNPLDQATPNLLGLLSPLREEPAVVGRFETVLCCGEAASRGRVLKEKQGAALSLLSGWAKWVDGQPYLVPGDAFEPEQPGCLVPLADWPGLLVADLWVEGDLAAFEAWLFQQGPPCFLVCLHPSRESYLQAQVPGKNRFTQAWGLAFAGEPSALEQEKLTLTSLAPYLQEAGLPVVVSGECLLADFSGGLLDPLGLRGSAVLSLGLKSDRPCRVKEVLTEVKHWSKYTEKQLEYSVNHNLEAYLSAELGQTAVKLRQILGLRAQDIQTSEVEVVFQAGRLECQFEIEHKKLGRLSTVLWVESYWFAFPNQIRVLVDQLPLDWSAVIFQLSGPISPKQWISSLQAKGWQLSQELEERVVAHKLGLDLSVEVERIEIQGSQIGLLFSEPAGNRQIHEILGFLG